MMKYSTHLYTESQTPGLKVTPQEGLAVEESNTFGQLYLWELQTMCRLYVHTLHVHSHP